MRIGIVSGEFPPMKGGVGACSQILAQHLHDRGHELFVFSDPQARSEELPLACSPGGWGPRALMTMRRWARQQHLEVVNLQFQTAAFNMSPWIHYLPIFLGSVPLVTTFHDLRFPWLFPKAGALRERIVLQLARSSSAVICTNHEDYARLEGQLRCATMIPIGSNILAQRPPDFDPGPWRKRAGATDNETLLTWFGLVNHSKGLDTLLQCLADLRNSGLKLSLVLIGGEAGDSDRSNFAFRGELDTQVTRLGLESALHRTGYIAAAEVAAWLWACDLAVLPFRDGASFRRGSLMAAIQHGCATVTTTPRVTVPEFVHGHNLWLVPPDDTQALGAALRTLLASSECQDKLQLGAARLAARFDWDSITADYVAFFEAMLEGCR